MAKQAEDKVIAATILSAAGLRYPNSVGVIDKSQRLYPGLPTIATPDALRGLLTDLGPGEIFGKIHNGMISLGAFNIRASDSTHIHCDGFDPMTYEDFLTHFVGENSYLLQKRLENHTALNPYASGLATVRMINLVRENDIFTPFAIISMPQGDNIADTLWRSGNIACDIDVASGAIRTVVTREGPEIAFLPDHPATAGLMGMVLPHWDLLVETNARAARLFGPIKYQSTDIAITQDGPVIVELNYGSGFGLPQNASGRGLLTPEVVAFFEQHGATLGANAPARKKGSSLAAKHIIGLGSSGGGHPPPFDILHRLDIARRAFGMEGLLPSGECSGGDRTSHLCHKILIIMQVMPGQQHRADNLLAAEHMVQIGAAE